ncbi:MAG: hypothetical protein L0219_18515 [Phycisphaerales bacterium]|nr:hypothetical protein [Phycisphaerales bacterium]
MVHAHRIEKSARIKNERQYRITKAQAIKFRRALAEMRLEQRRRAALDGWLAGAEYEGLASQLDDLVREIKDYERLRVGRSWKTR